MSTEIAQQKKTSLLERFGDRYGVDPVKIIPALKATVFKAQKISDKVYEVTNEEFMMLLVVADQHKLNPFTKEIFAFIDTKRGGIVPVVSVDGWSRIINEHPQFDGMDFAYSDELVTMPSGKPCPAWCEISLYRKDRNRPTIVREYLDEVYQAPRGAYAGPWQTHTKRFLRHKTLIQGARIAFGFAGIYDEDEAARIVDDKSAPNKASIVDAEVVLPEFSDEAFSSGIDAWTALIVSGKKTPADIIATIESSGKKMTAEQKLAIEAIREDREHAEK